MSVLFIALLGCAHSPVTPTLSTAELEAREDAIFVALGDARDAMDACEESTVSGCDALAADWRDARRLQRAYEDATNDWRAALKDDRKDRVVADLAEARAEAEGAWSESVMAMQSRARAVLEDPFVSDMDR